MFTRDSAGEPKEVPLSHRNLLANLEQLSEVNLLLPTDSLLVLAPLGQSFGFTVGLWYPILEGFPLIAVPPLLDAREVAEAVRTEKPTVALATSCFLREAVHQVDPEELSSLRFVVAGVEELSPELCEAFERKFGISIMTAYGLPETGAVVSVNLPNPPPPKGELLVEGSRPRSVGRLLPGMTPRVAEKEGPLVLRGANVARDGWLITGDRVRFDEDGFLFLEQFRAKEESPSG